MKPPIRLAFTGLLLTFSTITFAQESTPIAVTETAAPAATEIAAEAPLQSASVEAPLDRTKLSYSNKWRINVDNEAKSDGSLVFRLVMKNTKVEPITVTIPIKKGINENNAADVIEDAMQKAFPRDFNIETDDGESVLVKLNPTEGSSNLSLLSNDVENLKIKIKKE
jgi:hypothetical protein